jgi:hypothetical protein
MIVQIEALVAEVTSLRESNAALRQELRDAVSLFDRAATVLAGRPNGSAMVDGTARRKRRGTAAPKGRVTPSAVTTEVVRAVLLKLGEATASEIADEITKAGAPVSGRAIRFLAEGAGATTSLGEDGLRRYRL